MLGQLKNLANHFLNEKLMGGKEVSKKLYFILVRSLVDYPQYNITSPTVKLRYTAHFKCLYKQDPSSLRYI